MVEERVRVRAVEVRQEAGERARVEDWSKQVVAGEAEVRVELAEE